MATISQTLRDQPTRGMCEGCEQRVNFDTHDEVECRRENGLETDEEREERLRDIAEDRAFEAYREDRLFGRDTGGW